MNSNPTHNLKIWSLSTLLLEPTLSEPISHWLLQILLLVIGHLSPSEPSTKSQPSTKAFPSQNSNKPHIHLHKHTFIHPSSLRTLYQYPTTSLSLNPLRTLKCATNLTLTRTSNLKFNREVRVLGGTLSIPRPPFAHTVNISHMWPLFEHYNKYTSFLRCGDDLNIDANIQSFHCRVCFKFNPQMPIFHIT